MKLFLTAFIQVYFVSLNTCFLSTQNYFGVTIAAFMVSLVWCFNVKRIAFGGNVDKIIYSFGATAGSLSGLLTSSYL